MINNKLLIIPSIDIRDSKTVRVVQGIPELNCTNYGNDPVEMALIWRAENAKCIHVVDFNSSQENSKSNNNLIKEICDSVIIPVQVGGGIKTLKEAEELISMGVYRLIIGTMAYKAPDDFANLIKKYGSRRIVAAIDILDNEVVINSRKTKTGLSPIDYALELKKLGVERFVVTNVNLSGVLEGPDLELSKKIALSTNIKVTHSGGIRNVKDLKETLKYTKYGIDSVIIGRALYENKFPCQKIWRMAEAGIF